jgi:hypothetical protein
MTLFNTKNFEQPKHFVLNQSKQRFIIYTETSVVVIMSTRSLKIRSMMSWYLKERLSRSFLIKTNILKYKQVLLK